MDKYLVVIEEFLSLKPKAIISDPFGDLFLVDYKKTSKKVKKIILLLNDFYISRIALKHFVESRSSEGVSENDITDLARSVVKVIERPSKIVDNSHKRKNSYLFLKTNGRIKGVVVELVGKTGRNNIVSIHYVKKTYYDKLEDIQT